MLFNLFGLKFTRLITVLLSIFAIFAMHQMAYSAPTHTFDKIIVFGDSLSDAGNLYRELSAKHQIDPNVPVLPLPPYVKGHFTNGVTWIEILAKRLGLLNTNQFKDFAYGGSWAESSQYSYQDYPYSLTEEVSLYLKTPEDPNKNQHLYVLWSGNNDYLTGRENFDFATSNTVQIIKQNIDTLIHHGARNFLVANLPDLGIIPIASNSGPEAVAMLHALSTTHNKKLAAMLAQEQKIHENVTFILFDIESLLNDATTHPEKYGFKNVKDACFNGSYTSGSSPHYRKPQPLHFKTAALMAKENPVIYTVCRDPDTYLYWDIMHPTEKGHQLMSDKAFNLLNPQ